MSDPRKPEDPHRDDTLEAALRAAHEATEVAPSLDAPSRLHTLAESLAGGPLAPPLLRDTSDDGAPLVMPGDPTGRTGERERYQLFGEIARGGVGVVLRGRDTDLGREVAMKVLRSDRAASPRMVQRFVEEAQISGQLQHPGILPVYELGLDRDGRRPYFTMKLVRGQTLASVLRDREEGEARLSELVEVFRQIAHTVAYAHAKGVVHRDLKPSNVMVGRFGEVQVLDWGLAKVLSRGGLADEASADEPESLVETVRTAAPEARSIVGSVMGTPAYMAPEQARGEVDRLDERADVFSLGAILCEMLTGRPPYVGRSDQLLARAAEGRLDEVFARLERCGGDDELVALARQCLSPEPGRRPRDAGEVARTVDGHLRSLADRARASELRAAEAAARASEERRARRLTLALAASVLTLMTVGSGGCFWVQQERRQRDRVVHAAVASTAELLGSARAARRGEPSAWAEVAAGAAHLRQTLAAASVEPATEQQARELLESVERADRDRRMLERIEQAVVDGSTHAELARWEAMERDLEQAFRDYGIDLHALDGATVVQRIRASEIAVELAHGLDLWIRTSFVVTLGGRPEPSMETIFERLELLYQADPDPIRTTLRKTVFAHTADPEPLRRIVDSDDYSTLSARTRVILMTSWWRTGDEAAWRAVARDALARFPDDFQLHNTYAYMLTESGRWHDAARFWQSAIALRPTAGGLWRSLGRVQIELGDGDAAAIALARAVELEPDYAPSRVDLGRALRAAGRTAEALAALEAALRIDPTQSLALSELEAICSEATGR